MNSYVYLFEISQIRIINMSQNYFKCMLNFAYVAIPLNYNDYVTFKTEKNHKVNFNDIFAQKSGQCMTHIFNTYTPFW